MFGCGIQKVRFPRRACLKTRHWVELATGLFRRQVAAEHGLVARSTHFPNQLCESIYRAFDCRSCKKIIPPRDKSLLVTPGFLSSIQRVPEWLAIIILGIIEGITEFLPISSTGHLLIAEKWLPRQSDLFNIVIQSAAVLAVIPLFKERVLKMLTAGRDLAARDYTLKVLLAFGITGVGGLILEKMHLKLPEKLFPVGMALLVGGVVIMLVESRVNERRWRHEVTWKLAVLFGLGQLVAAYFPGASRSGTTIMLALLFGMSRPAATEFSFLVGIPTMLAAGGYKVLKSFHQGAPAENWDMVLLGTIVSGIVSFIAVKWLLRYVQSHNFIGFGWYRIVVGGLILIGGLFGWFGPGFE